MVPQPHASPCVLAAADSAQDLAAELVHYGFLREVGGVRGALGGRRVYPAAGPPCLPPLFRTTS